MALFPFIPAGRICIAAGLAVFFSATVASAQYIPYRRIAKAAATDESPISQAKSTAINVEWKAALVAEAGLKGLELKTFVLMQRGFAVGFVNSAEQHEKIVEISKAMPLRSVEFYLPIRTEQSKFSEASMAGEDGQDQTPAFFVKRQIKSALRQYGFQEALKIDVVVLDHTAILVGIVNDEQERQAVLDAASSAPSIQHVVNHLLLPEAGYDKMIQLPRIFRR